MPASGRIAFYSSTDGSDEIYTMNADGSNQSNLTNNLANVGHPDWDLEGHRV